MDSQRAPSNDPITVSVASIDDAPAWDDFVSAHHAGTFFHRYGWATITARVYGYKPFYLMAKNDHQVTGVLPLTLVNSPITGKALISTAFTVGGGILANDPQTEQLLLEEAATIGRHHNVEYVELRAADCASENWVLRDNLYANFTMPIADNEEALLKSIPRKRRAELRKSLALLEAGELSICEKRDIDRFFALYSAGLRDLGTPVFPKKFVRALIDVFSNDVGFITILHNDKPVTALLSFYHGEKVLPYYVGALPQARGVRAFDLVYWHQLLIGAKRGKTVFDFGRSKVETGSYGYKKTWGITPEPLGYRYHLINAKSVPEINPTNPKFALATKVWRRLPVPLATFGGSILARHFG